MKISDFKDIHPDIMEAELRDPHGNGNVVSITTPATGVFGGEKKEHLWELTYECNCSYAGANPHDGVHEHKALYGPRVIHFSDDCKNCEQSKYRSHDGHQYIPIGNEVLDETSLELYAD